MLSDDQKKEYMEIMHEYAKVRSEIEGLMYPTADIEPTPTNEAPDSINNFEPVNPPDQNSSTTDDDTALAELRAKLNI